MQLLCSIAQQSNNKIEPHLKGENGSTACWCFPRSKRVLCFHLASAPTTLYDELKYWTQFIKDVCTYIRSYNAVSMSRHSGAETTMPVLNTLDDKIMQFLELRHPWCWPKVDQSP